MIKPPQAPTKEDILAFIDSHSGNVGTREIARAFGLKNADRARLKGILRNLADEGRLEKSHKKLVRPGQLPATLLADIVARDRDGDIIARPVEWDEAARGPSPRIRVKTLRKARANEVAGIGDRALLRIQDDSDGADGVAYTGRVIKVLDRAKQRMLGIFRSLPTGGGRLVPVDKKQLGRELAIPPGATDDARDGDLVAVDVARHGRFGLPTARVREKLGSLDSEKTISLIAIHTHDIPHVFPAAALAEAGAAKPATLKGREDWRDIALITIDPADAKDHDDAVHAAPDPNPENRGGHIVTVAIADVAYYVRPGSALDREALLRGNSVYFPDRVVPMLPERISNDLCSLRPGEDRPALAARMIIGADGRKRSHTFHRVLMRSHAKLSYVQTQAAVDGKTDSVSKEIVADVLKPLFAAYDAIKQERDARQPLDLDVPERKIILKPDGTLDRVTVPERLDAHKLIEEFMILANVAAAETLEKARTPLIYRVHDEPSLEKLEALREFLRMLDINLPKGAVLKPNAFNRILARVKGTDVERLVNDVILRSQAQAEYNSDNFGHFGLSLRRYAHFTSPIRRYADLIVHRGLIRALKLGDGGLPDDADPLTLAEIAARISAAERRAMKAERETVDRLIAHFLADRIGARFEGHISGVTRAGLFVRLDETGADGFIPASTIGNDYYRFEEAQHALVGQSSGETHRLGDRVSVRLVEAAPVAGALRFELLSEGRPSPRRPVGAKGNRGKGRDKTRHKPSAKPGRAKRPPSGRSPRRKSRGR
ncbi:MAG: ribonuclease R [Variibacter sp.]